MKTADELKALGVRLTHTRFKDEYYGKPQALIDAGIITAQQLEQQPGRPPGRMCFSPDGTPAPIDSRNGWRTPGHVSISLWDDGTCFVGITVSREQVKQRCAREREKAELQLQRELEKEGPKLAQLKLTYKIESGAETWTGTKAQLQAAGFGVGMAFPGEPGAPKKGIECTCPLGYPATIRPAFDEVAAAAGIFYARCRYMRGERWEVPESTIPYAPGVVQVLNRSFRCRVYEGTAPALVAAGLAQHLGQFPGLPGSQAKGRASFTAQHAPRGTTSANPGDYTIKRHGAGTYSIEVGATKEERKALDAERDKYEAEYKRDEPQARARRIAERRGESEPNPSGQPVNPMTAADFLEEQLEHVERAERLLLHTLLHQPNGYAPHRFDDELLNDAVSSAFTYIRRMLEEAPIYSDDKADREEEKGLASLLAYVKAQRGAEGSRPGLH